ncbi:ATP-binding cassette domain-containing protein, partial [Roseomonas rosulenta]|uniref:ATP-binding cassette domain-containing protein n=1 Tax=Roseomonas rosulenta TaxID=2748667 RepID=UPI0018E026D0
MNDHPPLRLAGVERRYRTEAGELPVLRGADLTLVAGEIVALVAPSGTGKSTLLHLAGLLERPDDGEVFVAGRAAGSLSDDARTAIRRTTIGFVYQFHHLLPEFTAEENIALPQMAAGVARGAAGARA